MPKIRTRFAPSPTGFLHIGSLRTALFSYLIAKSRGGDVVLRIEDTDQKRKVEGAVEKLIEILNWAGIKFDEGPHIGGNFGPYIQTERLNIYQKYIDKLLEKGSAYYCFCSPERLRKMRATQRQNKQPPRYDMACRHLSKKEIEKKLKTQRFVIRQKMPLKGEVAVYDELRGNITFKAVELEDQILVKSNGIPTYQLANVVDDHLMAITHVLRGAEWISSFPKNILLYRALGWLPPKFIHLPLTLSGEGGKLSKRQGDTAVEDYRAAGYLPEALINFCALLGWSPYSSGGQGGGSVSEIFTMNELVKKFKISDMGVSPAIFDKKKLNYLNGYYIRHKLPDELTELCRPYLGEQARNKADNFIKNAIRLEQERLKKLSDIKELTKFFFADELVYGPDLLIWKKMDYNRVGINLQKIYELLKIIPEKNWTNDSIEDCLMSYIKSKELKTGEYLWPMRVALTGRRASPGPFDVAEVLGKGESLKRIKNAIDKVTQSGK